MTLTLQRPLFLGERVGRRSRANRPGLPAGLRLWFGVVLAGLLALFPGDAFAHGALRRSDPSNGAHLSVVPRELRLTFTEDVELAFARLAVAGPNGTVELAPLELSPDSATVLVGAIRGPLVAGTYTVNWQVAGEDGHPVRGSYSFVIAPGAQGTAVAAPVGPTAPGQVPPPATHHEAVTFPEGTGFDAESPLYAAVRWLNFLGLLGMLGAVAFQLVLWLVRRQKPPFSSTLSAAAGQRAARLGMWMALLLAVAALLRLYAQSYALHGSSGALDPGLVGTMLARTTWGWGWVLQAAGTALALGGFALTRRAAAATAAVADTDAHRVHRHAAPPVLADVPGGPDRLGAAGIAANAEEDSTAVFPPLDAPLEPHGVQGGRSTSGTVGWTLAVLGGVALAFATALSGHAASTARLAPLPILTDALHILGAGGWLGSLLVLVLVGIPVALHLAPPHRGPAVASLVNAFSPTALFFAGTVVATGVFAAWLHLGTVPALWESTYGRTLLLKLAVLSVVFGTGAYNWLRVKPTLGEERAAGRLRRSAILELAVGVVVLAVTAVLVATATPSTMDMDPDGSTPATASRQ